MNFSDIVARMRRYHGPKDTIEVAEGNAFYDPADLIAMLERNKAYEADFVAGIRDAEAWYSDTPRDPFEAVQEGRPPYMQAALAFAQYRAHIKALEAGTLTNLVARAGYSFANYTMFMLNAGASCATTTHGGYARARAQEQSCKSSGVRAPFRHLFTVSNSADSSIILTEIARRHPTCTVAIAAHRVIAVASPERIEMQFDWLPKYEPKNDMPYHHPDCMGGAPGLFLTWISRHVDLNSKPEVPLISGRLPATMILEGGTLADQATLITDELALPVSWIMSAQFFVHKRIVALTVGAENTGRSKLEVATTPPERGSKAPGTWERFAA